ncbi:MAG TPA: site-2 protease family protein [Gemmatimonadaceae bacterium]
MDFQSFLLIVPVLLFSVIAHEYAHGYVALREGDTTALSLGRLTWNPLKHIDPFMTVILPLMLWIVSHGSMLLGGAKPVPVDPRNYRNYKRGDILVSLAGVVTNLIIAIGCVGVFVLVGLLGRAVPATSDTLGILQAMMFQGLRLNLILIAFNLIPIPPLDGSHVVKYLMPASWAIRYQQISRYGLLLLILLLGFGGALLEQWMRPAMVFGTMLIEWASPYSLPTFAKWLT